MANIMVKFLEIETSLAQQEAGIRVNNAENKTLSAEQAACTDIHDKRYWTSTILTTINNRSNNNDTKLAGFRRAVSKKGVEVAVAKKQVVQNENHADQIESVA